MGSSGIGWCFFSIYGMLVENVVVDSLRNTQWKRCSASGSPVIFKSTRRSSPSSHRATDRKPFEDVDK